MQWLNIDVPLFLNSPEFKRSTPEQRGIWLTLMGYCVQQENGGAITGTEPWSEWEWLSVLGVPPGPVKQDCTLWHWGDGAVLFVHGYPLEKQKLVQRNRRAGRVGGSKRTEAKARAARVNATRRTQAEAKHEPSTSEAQAKRNPSAEPTEGERKENRKRKGKEGEQGTGSVPACSPPSLEAFLAHAAQVHPDWPESDAHAAWAHYQAAGWVLGRGRPVRSWQACVETCYARWRGGMQKTSRPGGAREPALDLSRPNAHTGGLEVFDGPVTAAAGDQP